VTDLLPPPTLRPPTTPRLRPTLLPRPTLAHLARLTDEVGLFEHAAGLEPRRRLGYCTDDVARGLLVVTAEPPGTPERARLEETYLAFLERAQQGDGRFRGRLSSGGRRWIDECAPDDAVGRALRGLAAAACHAGTVERRRRALACFDRSAPIEGTHLRPHAAAVIGAVAVLRSRPGHRAALEVLERGLPVIVRGGQDGAWPWPEPRLAYENALVPHALVAAGAALRSRTVLVDGLNLLEWLVGVQRRGDRFSFVPAAGWASGERRPGFDQQPIEAGAMADACARSFAETNDPRWGIECLRAAAWFLGGNDTGMPLRDPASGGCRDGLERDGVNVNEGAESTLALIRTLQVGRAVQAALARRLSRSAVRTVAAPT
jgi:hypothetical protein